MNNLNKLRMHSPNLTQTNMARIRELFPNCVTEAIGEDGKVKLAVDFDLLRQELSESIVEGPQERYRLDWPGKREALLAANAPIAKTLRPCREESVDFDTTKNLYIEGDNLDALKLLQETYLGKVKMIYIDPPYNTGNDFIYEDDFAENTDEFLRRSNQQDEEGNRLVANAESNGRFHSDWLSMMYPRLKLARNLLRDDGVIFISCDDNEQINITKVCDEIFSASNGIGPIIQDKENSKNDTLNVQKNHDFIIIYRKQQIVTGTKESPSLVRSSAVYRDVYSDGDMYYYVNDPITTRGDGGTLNARPNLGYTIYYNPQTEDKFALSDYDIELAKISNELDKVYKTDKDIIENGYVAIRPPLVRGRLGCWTWSLDKFNKDKDNIIITGKKSKYTARQRTFVDKTSVVEHNGKLQHIAVTNDNSRSILRFSTSKGTDTFNATMDERNMFNNPKNVKMITYFINLINDTDSIILDFFAGSSTTAHAVMQLNAEDGGNRQFIMVQLPEPCDEKSDAYRAGYKTIAEIGKERTRRAGAKIKTELAAQHSQNAQGSLLDDNAQRSTPLDVGFRVLKVDSSNMADVYYTPDTLNQSMLDMMTDNIKLGRTPEDLLFQVLLDWGVDLTLPIRKETILGKTVFFVDENALVACFDTGLTEELVKELACVKPLRVVFRDNGFSSDAVKINATQIFRQLSPGTEVKSL